MVTWEELCQILLAEDVHFLISRLQMQSHPFAVQISLETWPFDAHLKGWHTLHARFLSDFRIVFFV